MIYNDNSIPKSDLIVLPGGFSYGDYLKWKYSQNRNN